MSIKIEQQLIRSIREQREFLLHELEYTRLLCLEYSNSTDRFFADGLLWIENMKEYLTHFKSRDFEKLINEHQFWDLYITHTQQLSSVAQAFQNATQQHIARRRRSFRIGAPVDYSHFSLAEIHPDFADAVRSIEAVNNRIHDVLHSYFHHLTAIPPILAVSAYEDFSLVKFPQPPWIYNVMYQQNDELSTKYIGWVLTLSWISMPRWSPVQLRYSALLAHEHFHRVMMLCEVCDERISRLNIRESKESKLLTQTLSRMEGVFGSHIIELSEAYDRLLKSVTIYVSERGKDLSSFLLPTEIGGWPFPLGHTLNKVLRRSMLTIAKRTAREFMCDLFGLVLLGPAYVWSLFYRISNFKHFNNDMASKALNISTHPPSILRLEMLFMLLENVGFEELAHQMRESLRLVWNKNVNQKYEENRGIQESLEWLGSTRKVLVQICNTMDRHLGGSFWSLGNNNGGYDKWKRRAKEIADAVEGGELEIEGDVKVEDILGAIWWRVLYSRRKSDCYTGWLLSLSKRSE